MTDIYFQAREEGDGSREDRELWKKIHGNIIPRNGEAVSPSTHTDLTDVEQIHYFYTDDGTLTHIWIEIPVDTRNFELLLESGGTEKAPN